MTRRIWLIGGTQESATLARAIAQADLPCIVSVTTESARSLYPISPRIEVCVDRFDHERLILFLKSQGISVVLDASHPFAVEISKSAIAVCSELKIPYLRFERETTTVASVNANLIEVDRYGGESGVPPKSPILGDFETAESSGSKSPTRGGFRGHQPTETKQNVSSTPKSVANFEELLATDWLFNQRVLLTIGYRYLSLFQPLQDRATLFARILPSQVALDAALQAGFTSDRIIAIRPPIGYEFERSLWQQWQISTVVTKASGAPGGEEIKRQVATELGVQLILIERPTIDYPQVTNQIEAAIEFCRRFVDTN